MKKIAYWLLSSLLFVSATAFGQTPQATVDEVLAKMPTTYGAQFDALMAELASTGEAGVLELAGKLNPPGQGPNAKTEYALSGLSHWVSAEGREAQRLATSNAYIKALGQATDREIKALFIRQLQLMGKEEAVAALTALLDDESLKGPAQEALAAISGNALPRVAARADELGLDAPRTAALAEQMANATDAKKLKVLRKALKDDDRRYRYAALDMVADYPWMYREVLTSALPKATDAASVDILNWLAQEADVADGFKGLSPQVSAAAVKYLKSGDAETIGAAAGLLAKSEGTGAITALAGLLRSDDTQIVDIAASALASIGGNVAGAVAPIIPSMGAAGKVAALGLLADRKAAPYSAEVFAQVGSDDPEVRRAAYTALKDVVAIEDESKLWPILASAPSEDAPFVQQAISATMSELSPAERYEVVSDKMNAAPAARQYLYYPLYSSTGNPEALTLIAGRFDSESGAAKDSAFEALMGWNDAGAADKLLAICKDPAGAPYFDRALARYTALASDPSLSGGNRAMMLVDALDIARTDAQKRAILNSMATTGSRMAMSKAGDYLDYGVNNVRQAAANAVMAIALGNSSITGDDVRELLNKVSGILDNSDADYQRQAIRRHLDAML